MKNITIIIPCFNEQKNIPIIIDRIDNVFSNLENYDYKIIFINDGSIDDTQKLLERIVLQKDNIKYIELSRNFGHQAALKAGFNYVEKYADAVISMDGDLQHPPELIPELIREWEKGNDIVYTLRTYNNESTLFKRITSRLYYKIIALSSDLKFEEGEGADFRLIDRDVLKIIKDNKETDLFLRGLVKWIGFKQVGVEYHASDRLNGTSQYTLKKMLKLALDGVTSFSVKPLYLAAYMGLFLSFLSLFYIPYVLYSLIVHKEISGWASLIITIVFFGGIQLIILGIIGIYLGKIFKQVKARPIYIVRKKN